MTGLSRRHVLVGGLALAALAACSENRPCRPGRTRAPVEDRIGPLERRHDALIGVFATNLDTGKTVAHRAQESFAMCSTFKTYAAARVLQMAERGELTLNRAVTIEQSDILIATAGGHDAIGRRRPERAQSAAAGR